MMFRPGVYSSPVLKKLSGYEVAEIALLTPTAPCHDLVPVRHPMSSSRGFPLFTGCSNPGSFAGNHPVYPPGAAGPLGRYPAITFIALGMDPVTKRNTRVSNRTISHDAGTQAHGHSQPEGLILLPVPGSRTGQASFDRIRLSGAPLSLDHAEVGLGGSHPGRWRGGLTDPCLWVPSEIVVIGKKRNS